MVIDVGLTRGRDETWKVVATTARQQKIPPLSVLALIVLILVAPATVGTAKADEPTGRAWSPRAYPTVRWFTRRGLDSYHNKLDAVVRIGVPCPQYRRIWPGDCPTEYFLTKFLKSLPPDLTSIAGQLISFGAVCRKFGQRLTCIYRKHETYKQELSNKRITEEVYYYTAKLNVVKRNGKLVYSTSFDRKVRTIHEDEPPEREAGVLGRLSPKVTRFYRR